jgi:hypothetical protein
MQAGRADRGAVPQLLPRVQDHLRSGGAAGRRGEGKRPSLTPGCVSYASLGDHELLKRGARFVCMLWRAGAQVQLPDAAALLADPSAMMTEVNDELQFAKGVSGVPFFIFNVEGEKRRALTLSGAQPPDLLLEAIEEMAQ